MRKKTISIVTIILIIGFAIGIIIYSNNKSTPEGTIKTFQEAFNNNDINKMLDCLTPELQEKVDDLIQKTDKMAEVPVALIIESMPLLSGMLDTDVPPNINMEILQEEVNADKATLTINVKVVDSNKSIKAELIMIKIKNQWYIKAAVPKLF